MSEEKDYNYYLNDFLYGHDSDDEYDKIKYIVSEIEEEDDDDTSEVDDEEVRFCCRYDVDPCSMTDFCEEEIKKRRLNLKRTKENGINWFRKSLRIVRRHVKEKLLKQRVREFRKAKKAEKAIKKAEKAEERTEKAEKKRLLQLANETKAEKRLREKAEAEKKKAKAEKKKESLFAAQFRKSFRKGKKSV